MKNKRELIQMCADKQRENWKSGERTSAKAYDECKKICAENGVIGECFHQIWGFASKIRAIEDNGREW